MIAILSSLYGLMSPQLVFAANPVTFPNYFTLTLLSTKDGKGLSPSVYVG
jgi:hypothetical protein